MRAVPGAAVDIAVAGGPVLAYAVITGRGGAEDRFLRFGGLT